MKHSTDARIKSADFIVKVDKTIIFLTRAQLNLSRKFTENLFPAIQDY